MSAVPKLAWMGVSLVMALAACSSAPAPAGLHEQVQSRRPNNVLPAATPSGLTVQDRSHDNDNPDNTLYALYQIIDTGTSAVPLATVTMRYWFTNDTPGDPLVFECDWAQVSCGNISARFVVLSSPVRHANTYVEIRFKAGAGESLAPGQSTGEIQTRVHHVNWSAFNTTESYSFISDPSFVYKNTPTVTLYRGGALVWGVEPKK
jgi:hypothetical protein